MRILGYNYGIIRDLDMKDIENGNAGLVDLDKHLIYVGNDMDDDSKTSVIIHEIIEAINYHLELKLKHPQIMAFEVGIHQVLVENGVDLSPLLKDK